MKNAGIVLTIIAVLTIVTIGVVLWRTTSNRQVVDGVWHFDTGYVMLPDGEFVVGNVVSWTDFDDSDMIQVRINNITYFTHSSNVVLTHNH